MNIGNRLIDVHTGGILLWGNGTSGILHQKGEKLHQKSLNVNCVVFHHVQNIGFCSVNLCAGKNGMPDRQACEPQIFFGIMTADANPEITPGIH